MISQVCVNNSVHRGGRGSRGACVGGGHVVGVVCMAGVCMVGACVARETATAADGTHPTGMHSCLAVFFKFLTL